MTQPGRSRLAALAAADLCAPAVRSSFHATIEVLEGLLAYGRAGTASHAFTAARLKGPEYLLERRRYSRLSTGEVADRALRVLEWYGR